MPLLKNKWQRQRRVIAVALSPPVLVHRPTLRLVLVPVPCLMSLSLASPLSCTRLLLPGVLAVLVLIAPAIVLRATSSVALTQTTIKSDNNHELN